MHLGVCAIDEWLKRTIFEPSIGLVMRTPVRICALAHFGRILESMRMAASAAYIGTNLPCRSGRQAMPPRRRQARQ